jgi:hypothetical protein
MSDLVQAVTVRVMRALQPELRRLERDLGAHLVELAAGLALNHRSKHHDA